MYSGFCLVLYLTFTFLLLRVFLKGLMPNQLLMNSSHSTHINACPLSVLNVYFISPLIAQLHKFVLHVDGSPVHSYIFVVFESARFVYVLHTSALMCVCLSASQ